MIKLKNILLVTALTFTLPTLSYAGPAEDLQSLKNQLVTVDQKLNQYNEAIAPYKIAYDVYPQIKLEDFTYYRDSSNKLQFVFKISNHSNLALYRYEIPLKISSTEVPNNIMSVTESSTSIQNPPIQVPANGEIITPARNLSVSPYKNAGVGSMRTEYEVRSVLVKIDDKNYTVKADEVSNTSGSLTGYQKLVNEYTLKKADLEKRIADIEATLPQ